MTLSADDKSEIFLTNVFSDDCGVIAIQAITGVSRSVAMSAAQDEGYTKDGEGMPTKGVLNAIAKLTGKIMVEQDDLDDYFQETVATYCAAHDDGVYLLFTKHFNPRRPERAGYHFVTLRDGDPYNAGQLGQFWHDAVIASYRLP